MNEIIPRASGIYKITCTANQKIYIGSAVNLQQRQSDHFKELRQNRHHNPKLQNAWNKYGEDAFTFEVWELVLPMSLTAREQYWLNKLKPFGNKGFNIAREAGSQMGVKHSPEAIEKSRQAHLGMKFSPEVRERMSQTRKGRVISPKQREKISQANTGKKRTPEVIEKNRQARLGNTYRLGKKHTPEACEKMRQANLGNTNWLGRKHTPEAIEKIRQAALARKARKRGSDGRFLP